jgi:hypothetical protein
MLPKPVSAAAAALALLLAACAMSGGNSGAAQQSPRNTAGQPVDAQTGVPLPGTPALSGGY